MNWRRICLIYSIPALLGLTSANASALAACVVAGSEARVVATQRALPNATAREAVGKRSAPNLLFVVLDAEKATYLSKGFVEVEASRCTADPIKLRRQRDDICRLSQFGNEAVQNQLTAYFGERPKNLCASSSRALGIEVSEHAAEQAP